MKQFFKYMNLVVKHLDKTVPDLLVTCSAGTKINPQL